MELKAIYTLLAPYITGNTDQYIDFYYPGKFINQEVIDVIHKSGIKYEIEFEADSKFGTTNIPISAEIHGTRLRLYGAPKF